MVVLIPRSVANARGARHYDPGMSLELGRVTDRRPPFKYSALARVWFSDTDAQGIVYYGRYLPYFDHARVAVAPLPLDGGHAFVGGEVQDGVRPHTWHVRRDLGADGRHAQRRDTQQTKDDAAHDQRTFTT